MSTGKHTPGPWRYCPNTYAKGRHVSHWEIYATEPVATVFAHLLAAEANARLIASAPDLLAALEKALETIEGQAELLRHCGAAYGIGATLVQVRAAIARATQ